MLIRIWPESLDNERNFVLTSKKKFALEYTKRLVISKVVEKFPRYGFRALLSKAMGLPFGYGCTSTKGDQDSLDIIEGILERENLLGAELEEFGNSLGAILPRAENDEQHKKLLLYKINKEIGRLENVKNILHEKGLPQDDNIDIKNIHAVINIDQLPEFFAEVDEFEQRLINKFVLTNQTFVERGDEVKQGKELHHAQVTLGIDTSMIKGKFLKESN